MILSRRHDETNGQSDRAVKEMNMSGRQSCQGDNLGLDGESYLIPESISSH